jgi:hypothetical protein
MSEKSMVENPVVKWARDHGVTVLKVNPIWYAGWNDRIFFVPGGKPVIVEFKAPGVTTVRPKQKARHKNLRKLGYDVHVIDTKQEGIALIESRLVKSSEPATKNRRARVGSS